MVEMNKVYHGDCLDVMKDITSKSVDMVLSDLPYGMTSKCEWDTKIPLMSLWEQYRRVIRDNGAIVLTASQPFTSELVMSNLEMFRYEWIWKKTRFSNQMLAKKQPLKIHENILVFGKSGIKYNPQNLIKVGKVTRQGKKLSKVVANGIRKTKYFQEYSNYPISIQLVKNETGLHSSQKPVKLFEYLIKTYTNKGDVVLDNCAGSGTTGIACQNTERKYILIEKELKFCGLIKRRLMLNLIQLQKQKFIRERK